MKNSHIEKLAVQANNGKIDLSNLMGMELEASSGNGLITARECRFTERLVMQTQNGAVTGKNLIGDNISMQTCNGFVTGNIIGNEKDYNIESSTKTGLTIWKMSVLRRGAKSSEQKPIMEEFRLSLQCSCFDRTQNRERLLFGIILRKAAFFEMCTKENG